MNAKEARKIISTAIDREVESYTFYKAAAGKVKDKALKSMFTELAGDEKKHREFLQAFLTRDPKTLKFVASADYKVVNDKKTPPLTEDMKPLDGLVVAIKKELEAMQMYTQLAKASADTETQFLFSQLANMESTHKARLEDIYTNMAFPEAW